MPDQAMMQYTNQTMSYKKHAKIVLRTCEKLKSHGDLQWRIMIFP